MKLLTNEKPHRIVSEEGKHIREINDVYVEEHEEEGQIIPEHVPYYTTLIYVPDSITEEMMNKMYVEESIEE